MPKTTTGKIIICAAITGSIHTPTMSDALPYRPEDIAAQAIGAAQAGAAVLHLHARDPADGRPSPDPEIYRRFLPQIAAATDAVVNITTGGSALMTIEQRLAAAQAVSPEMCSLNMGSMNFALHPMARKYDSWKFDWEEPYLRGSDNNIFRNTFHDIQRIAQELGGAHGVKFEHECYDVGHLYNLAHCLDAGWFKPPVFVQMVFGILGGIGAEARNLMFMKETADHLFGDAYQWSVLGAGRMQMPFAAQSAVMGGHVRVGLEDSLMIARGRMAADSAEQVAKIRRIVAELGREAATPEETRAMLGLKGKAQVRF